MDLFDLNIESFERDKLVTKIETFLNIKENYYDIIFLNGADAIIHFLLLTCFQKESISYTDLNYRYANKILELKENKEKIPISVEKEEKRILQEGLNTDIVYLTNPDNILGMTYRKEHLKNIITKNKSKLFIIDETYMDFSQEHSILNEYLDNVIVIKSFSKLFDLEKYRIGYIVTPKKNSELIRKVLQQYPLSSHSIERALTIDIEEVLEKVEKLKSLKKEVLETLILKEERFYKSETDFVSIENPSDKVIEKLKESNVKIKWFKYNNNVILRCKVDENLIDWCNTLF